MRSLLITRREIILKTTESDDIELTNLRPKLIDQGEAEFRHGVDLIVNPGVKIVPV